MTKWLKIGLDTSTASCLRNIKKYDDEIILYPGHGSYTNLGKEKRHFNYYF